MKNVILCFDGTRENFGPRPITNVLKIYQMLENDDRDVQICYYQPGIGTEPGFDPVIDIRRRFTSSHLSNINDAMFASSVDHHVVSGYMFLMDHCEAGDRIYMFGFSRGAFIARALAGMLERVGLLHKGLNDMVSMAWKIYELWEYAEQPSQPNYNVTLADEFKKTFSRSHEVRVHFQGLFDSVNSVGILRDRLFPCTQRSGIVDHVRHAVSLDERKGKFKQQSFAPNPSSYVLYSVKNNSKNGSLPQAKSPGSSLETSETDNLIHTSSLPLPAQSDSKTNSFKYEQPGPEILNLKERDILKKINAFIESADENNERSQSSTNSFSYEPLTDSTATRSTLTSDLVEKWFMGDHSDVGGGWGIDCTTRDSLSNISLRWMLSKAVEYGVIFKKGSLNEFAQKHNPIGSLVSTIHDKLSFNNGIKFGPLQPIDSPFVNDLERNDSRYTLLSGASFSGNMLRDYFTLQKFEALSDEDAIRQKYSLLCDGVSKIETFLWWCLELIPIGLRIENENGKWRNIYVPNLGRPRFVPSYADLHWSVFWRIKYDKRYRPKNLPAYAYKVLEEFEDINIYSPTLQNVETIASSLRTYPAISGTSEISSNKNDIKIMTELATEAQYLKNRKKFLKWDSKSWMEIPDDLCKVLEAGSQ